jgi:hypothetical protein
VSTPRCFPGSARAKRDSCAAVECCKWVGRVGLAFRKVEYATRDWAARSGQLCAGAAGSAVAGAPVERLSDISAERSRSGRSARTATRASRMAATRRLSLSTSSPKCWRRDAIRRCRSSGVQSNHTRQVAAKHGLGCVLVQDAPPELLVT